MQLKLPKNSAQTQNVIGPVRFPGPIFPRRSFSTRASGTAFAQFTKAASELPTSLLRGNHPAQNRLSVAVYRSEANFSPGPCHATLPPLKIRCTSRGPIQAHFSFSLEMTPQTDYKSKHPQTFGTGSLSLDSSQAPPPTS